MNLTSRSQVRADNALTLILGLDWSEDRTSAWVATQTGLNRGTVRRILADNARDIKGRWTYFARVSPGVYRRR